MLAGADGTPQFNIKWDEIMPADTDFAKMHQSRRNAEVKPVSKSVQAFFNAYGRPIPPVYGTLVNETLTTTHLSVYHYAFTYDSIFGFGFKESFDRFFAFFPDESNRPRLYSAMLQALDLDEKKIAADHAAIKGWLEGKSLADVMAMVDGSSSDSSCAGLTAAFQNARDREPMNFHFSRMFAMGVVYMLEAVGAKVEHSEAEQIATKLGKTSFYLKDAMDQYRSGMEKLKAAEQLYAEVNARDQKRLAERLAEKARQAEEEAKQLEAESVSSEQ